ncbi:hypothetical protein HPC49_09465, partial [Pyxidicoccus fallax]
WWARALGLTLGVCTALGCGGPSSVEDVLELVQGPQRPAPPPSEEPPPAPYAPRPGDPVWTHHVALSGYQDLVGLASDGAGGVIVLARNHALSTWGQVLTETGGLILSRYDGAGRLLWSLDLSFEPTPNSVSPLVSSALAVSPSGDIFVALKVAGWGRLPLVEDAPLSDRFLVKVGVDGAPRWVRSGEAEVLAATHDGGLVGATRDGSVVRYDAQGFPRWVWQSPWGFVPFTTVAVDREGNVVTAGFRSAGGALSQGLIVGLTDAGAIRWQTTTPEREGAPAFTDLALLPDGGALLTGTFSRTFLWGNYRVNPSCTTKVCASTPYLLALDAKGAPRWALELEGPSLKPRVAVGPDGDALVSADTVCASSLLWLSPSGEELWRNHFKYMPCTTDTVYPRDVEFLSDGTPVRAGMFSGPSTFIGGTAFTADQGDVFLERLIP